MTALALLAVLLVLGLCGQTLAREHEPLTIYVAPDGDDANSGTPEQPLATLAAARQAVRQLKQQGLPAPIEVILRPGIYHLPEPLVLGPEDSGTQTCPITWRAEVPGEAVLSGGVPITGWRKGEGDAWVAEVPYNLDFRLLRVGDRWATRARHPNYDPANPYAGGWIFAEFAGNPWERGALGVGVQNTHNVGDTLTWNIQVPVDGLYRVWLRYGHKMTDYGIEDMGGRSALQVDDGESVLLLNLPDTGAWGAFRWSHCADLTLTAGRHELRWRNLRGGGLNLDAFALCNDEDWDPKVAIGDFSWWGAFRLDPPAEGRHLLLIQAEACDSYEGPEIQVPRPVPPGTTDRLCYRAGALPEIADASGAEVHIFIAWGWVNAIVPVAAVDPETRRIVFADGGATQDVRTGNRFFIENVREALDAPGEWFLDRKAGQVLYLPDVPDFPQVPVVAAKLDRLIELRGNPGGGQFVEHVNIEGLRFADTTYTLTRDYYSPQDATVWLGGARHCAVRNCQFAWNGGYAVKLLHRSEQCLVRGNRMEHMGQGGVVMVGGTPVQPHHCSVIANTMQHLGLIYKHVAGVYLIHGSDNHIAHNRIWDVPRYAISCKSQGEERLSHRNVVEFNDLRRVNLETNDTGAIETLGYERRDSGNIIRYNLILDSIGMGTTPDGEIITPYFTWGVYLDDYSSGTTVYGNIIARTVNGGGCIHGGQNNTFENNIMVDGHEHQMRLQPRDDFMKGNRFVRNIICYSRPEAALIFSWNDRRDLFAEWDYNLYWLRGADLTALSRRVTPLGTFQDWLAAGFDAHSVVADPLFVDPAHDDYRLRENSPAFALGFQQIPVERIGPEGAEEERR